MESIVRSEIYDAVRRKNALDQLCARYSVIKKSVIGKSCGGRDIYAFQIGAGEEACLFAAAFHGSEHITAVVLMMFLEEAARAASENAYLAGLNLNKSIRGRSLIFVPCVNPDGCEISACGAAGCGNRVAAIGKLCRQDFVHWNANLRGVDINHNFDAGWQELRRKEIEAGIYGPRRSRFGGNAPESEPETVALTALCRSRRIRHVAALHSQGEVIYYRYGEKTPERGVRMAQIMATASGYRPEYPAGLAVGGGFKDWFIETFARPGFTIELGKGQNPLPPESAREIYEKAREMLTLCAIM